MTALRLWRRLAAVVLAVALLALLLFGLLLGMADRGMLDGWITRWVSAQIGRPVQVADMRFHLLSRTPRIAIRGLVIGNPSWLHGGNLAEVERLDAEVELGPLLRGTLRPRAIAISGLKLHLVRLGPNRNNWMLTERPRPGPPFAPLADVARLSITDSHMDVRDYGRDMILAGPFRHDPQGDKPFVFQAQGRFKGFPMTLDAAGGQLNGPGVGPPWPFRAHLVDAGTVVDAQGVAGQPFDLRTFDLGMAARGPNLADLGYLFNLLMPNSAPYRLKARARTDGEHFGFSNLSGQVGESDVAGWIKSDHSGPRRRVVAEFRSRTLARGDINALLAPVPPRAEARRASGAVPAVTTGRWLLPDATFGLARLRATDLDFDVHAERVAGYRLPLRDLSTHIVMSEGLLRFPDFRSSLYAGRLSGSGSLDARPATPRLSVRGRLEKARLAEISPQFGQPPDAAFDLALDLAGSGQSVHAAAGKAQGTVSLRVTGATMPRRAAWILGGDLLRALGNAGGKGVPAALPITCAAASFRADGDGVLDLTRFGVRTPLGQAQGSGSVDLGQERLGLLLQGQPLRKRAFQVATPIRVEGLIMAPRLTVLPGGKARALGLKGGLGLALTPVAGLLPIKGKAPAAMASDGGC